MVARFSPYPGAKAAIVYCPARIRLNLKRPRPSVSVEALNGLVAPNNETDACTSGVTCPCTSNARSAAAAAGTALARIANAAKGLHIIHYQYVIVSAPGGTRRPELPLALTIEFPCIRKLAASRVEP